MEFFKGSSFVECFGLETEENFSQNGEDFSFDSHKLLESPKRIFVYTKVNIRGRVFKALLDSGATRSFCNSEVANLLKGWNFPVHKNHMTILTPLGQKSVASEIIAMPVCLHGKIAQVTAKVLPDSDTPLILGTDSLHLFGVLLDFNDLSYCLASDPTRAYKFDEVKYEDLDDELCDGLNSLFELDSGQ